MATPENVLLSRCRTGDVQAFREVYERYQQPVYRCAYRILGHQDDAHDVAQETFVRAYQRLHAFGGRCSLQTWLFTICTNLCRDRMRSARHRREVAWDPEREESVASEPFGSGDPVAAAQRTEAVDAVLAALRTLPQAYREVIVLRDIEELELDEVAAAIGCPKALVSVRLYRARRMLKERASALLDGKG